MNKRRPPLSEATLIDDEDEEMVANDQAVERLVIVTQVEVNPVWQQKKLREFFQKKGIHVTAYSPLGARGTRWGTNRVMDCETLKEIADAKGKTVAQVCLRWVYEQGVSVLVKSFNKERIKENLDIFDWMLSPEESQKIDRIPQQKVCLGLQFISDQGALINLLRRFGMKRL